LLILFLNIYYSSLQGYSYGKNQKGETGFTTSHASRFSYGIGGLVYVKKEHCAGLGVEFRKVTQLAAVLIRELDVPAGVKVRVLFDSFFVCSKVVKACRSKGFRFVSTLKSNRNLYKRGHLLKAGKYARSKFHRSQT